MKNHKLVLFFLLAASLLVLGLVGVRVHPAATQAELPTRLVSPQGNNHEIISPLPPAGQPSEQSTLSGQVTDARGVSLEGLRVQALSLASVVGQAITGDAWRFTFDRLPVASYRLQVLRGDEAGGAPYQLLDPAAALVFSRPGLSQRMVVLALAPQEGMEIVQPGFTPPAPRVDTAGIQATGQITGVLTASDTGLPLQFAYINAYDAEGYYVSWAYTDMEGKYALTALATGEYLLQFYTYSGNYLPEWYDNKPDMDSADPVSVTDGITTPDINAALEPGGAITGLITAEDTASPLSEVTVGVYDSQGYYVTSGYPDSTGVYTITGLATGSYFVQFDPYGSSADYIGEYYDNKPDLDSADPVAVTEGNVTTGIDAALALGGSINGQVTTQEGGLPLEGVYANIYDSQMDYIDYASSDAAGNYSVRGLLSGTYYISFEPSGSGPSAEYIPEYYDDQPSFSSADPVAVTAPDPTNGIDAALALGGKITGQVTAQDSGLPLPNVSVNVYDTNGEYVDYDYTDANGVYTITQLAQGITACSSPRTAIPTIIFAVL
jgi:hypothetical protein